MLVGAKATQLGKPEVLSWLRELIAVSFRDVLFAATLGVVGQIASLVASQRPIGARVVRGMTIGVCAACAVFSVVSAGVFAYFERPLTYDLLRLAADLGALRSSISERMTPWLAAALIAAPALWFFAAWWGTRLRRVVFAGTVLTAGWLVAGAWSLATRDADWTGRRLALNPHWELVRSTFVGITGLGVPTLTRDFPADYQAEFRSVGARGVPSRGFVPPPEGARPRNVIVIVLESVGTRYMSLYGSAYATTPSLVAESSHALVFDNFYSHLGYTFCSAIAINYSIHPGLPWLYLPKRGERALPSTLASVLHGQGHRTAYLHNGDLEWDGLRTVIEGHGFELVLDRRDLPCAALTSWGTEDRCAIDRLIQWIDEAPDKPFFALCWTDQTHDPYAASPGVAQTDFVRDKQLTARTEDLSRYLNVLYETDRHLGRLFATLRERGLADDTLVVVTGDHGEAFAEPHDQRGHGFSLFEEDVHVPLMLWNPRLFTPGRRVDTIGSHMDINATIADVLDVPLPDESQGYSLFDPARPPRAYFVASIGEFLLGVREDSWKYIYDATNSHEMLFDLSRDPAETRNAAAAEPERARMLRARVAAFAAFEDEFLRGRRN